MLELLARRWVGGVVVGAGGAIDKGPERAHVLFEMTEHDVRAVATEIHPADDLPPGLFDELTKIVKASKRNPNRGFAMILDGLLDVQPHPGTLIAVAYDRGRNATAGV